MSGANSARNAIHQALRKAYAPVFAAGAAFAKTQQAAIDATDVVDVMGRTVSVILAAEHLKEMATEAEKAARSVLASQMNETGATQIAADHHLAYLSRKAAFVSIDQEDLLPPDYMRQAEPAPDKKAIKQAIEAGEDVPGCTLVRPNELQLVIRSKKE
jgi:hypothetical protein